MTFGNSWRRVSSRRGGLEWINADQGYLSVRAMGHDRIAPVEQLRQHFPPDLGRVIHTWTAEPTDYPPLPRKRLLTRVRLKFATPWAPDDGLVFVLMN